MSDDGPGILRRSAAVVGKLFSWLAAITYGGLAGYTIFHGPIQGELTKQSAYLGGAAILLCLFYLPVLWRGLDNRRGLLKALRYLLGFVRLLLAPLLGLLAFGTYQHGLPTIDDGIAYGARGCPPDAKPRGKAPPEGREIWCERRGSGVRHGPYAVWWPNDEPELDGWFEDGERHNTWNYWYEDGQLREISAYQRGKRHGEWKAWYPDGSLATDGTYLEGGLDGRVRRWHPSGELYLDMRYVEGRTPFEWLEFFPDGTAAGYGSIALVAELPSEWRRAVCHEDPARIERRGYELTYARVGRTETLVAKRVRPDPITGALVVEVNASPDWAPAHVFRRGANGGWQISEPFAPYPLRPWVEAAHLEEWRGRECD